MQLYTRVAFRALQDVRRILETSKYVPRVYQYGVQNILGVHQ